MPMRGRLHLPALILRARRDKKAWMETLTTWYKFRHNDSDAGLTEMIAGVTSKPLPPEPTPITTLPATTPAATATPASGTGAGNGAAPSKPATPPRLRRSDHHDAENDNHDDGYFNYCSQTKAEE